MAQSLEYSVERAKRLHEAKNESVSVAASGNTTLLDLPVRGLERLFVQFSVADNPLDAFVIKARCNQDATSITLYSSAADYTSPVGLLIGTSGDLSSVAAGALGWFVMDVRGLWDVTIQASASGGAASVSAYAGGY